MKSHLSHLNYERWYIRSGFVVEGDSSGGGGKTTLALFPVFSRLCPCMARPPRPATSTTMIEGGGVGLWIDGSLSKQ